MAQFQITNFGDSILAAGIAPGDTSISIATGTGSRFPALGAGDWFYAVLVDVSANREIVKVTARVTDTLTVTRAQEGTTALSFAVGSVIRATLTKQAFEDYMASLSSIYGVPSQTGNGGKVLFTNGTVTSWDAVPTPAILNHQQFGGL